MRTAPTERLGTAFVTARWFAAAPSIRSTWRPAKERLEVPGRPIAAGTRSRPSFGPAFRCTTAALAPFADHEANHCRVLAYRGRLARHYSSTHTGASSGWRKLVRPLNPPNRRCAGHRFDGQGRTPQAGYLRPSPLAVPVRSGQTIDTWLSTSICAALPDETGLVSTGSAPSTVTVPRRLRRSGRSGQRCVKPVETGTPRSLGNRGNPTSDRACLNEISRGTRAGPQRHSRGRGPLARPQPGSSRRRSGLPANVESVRPGGC